jgi:biotin synthase
MCYAIPGKVTAIENKKVAVDYFGEKKTAINEIVDLKVGDYIYAQGGYVIQTVPEKEAIETLETWKELFFELRETDVKLSRKPSELGVDQSFSLIIDKASEGRELNRDELLRLLKSEKPAEIELLYKTANFLRQKHLSNSCCVHGIIEFSNYCKNDCVYCGIRKSNVELKRYRMTEEEILAAAAEAIEQHGFKALVLQSGEDPEFPVERVAKLIKAIKARHAVLIFASVGETSKPGLKALWAAGAQMYGKLHCGDKLEERLEELREAYRLGFLVITGGLIGLPGQTAESLLDDILLTKELNAEMYTFGPVLPDGPPTELILKVLAVSRLVDPKNAKIVVTTGFETLDPEARRKGLLAGANSVMLNVTPFQYRQLYDIYPNRAHVTETVEQQIKTTLELLYSLGRAPTDLGI